MRLKVDHKLQLSMYILLLTYISGMIEEANLTYAISLVTPYAQSPYAHTVKLNVSPRPCPMSALAQSVLMYHDLTKRNETFFR